MKNIFSGLIPAFIFMALSFGSCRKENSSLMVRNSTKEAMLNINNLPHKKLSDYGFFKGNLADLKPEDHIVQYEVSSPLFTDYADKSRFVYVPDGGKAKYAGDFKSLDFPIGSILIKNFFYYVDKRQPDLGKRIIETRLLIKKERGWAAYDYKWNEEQTEAVRLMTGATLSVETILEDGTEKKIDEYVIPREADCKRCHNFVDGGAAIKSPLGPKPSNLNYNISYDSGEKSNQLERWVKLGILDASSMPKNIAKLPDYRDESISDLERGRGYLQNNCSHCHSPNGEAIANALYLNYDYDGEEINKGVMKEPTNFRSAPPGYKYAIVKGHPEKSILLHRMQINTKAGRMAPLGRSVVDEEGTKIIENYIKALATK